MVTSCKRSIPVVAAGYLLRMCSQTVGAADGNTRAALRGSLDIAKTGLQRRTWQSVPLPRMSEFACT